MIERIFNVSLLLVAGYVIASAVKDIGAIVVRRARENREE